MLASGFRNEAKNSAGIVSLLEHDGDPRGPWKVAEIDRLTTSHRLRWADFYGNGERVLVNARLTGAHAEAPEYRDHTPLVFYQPGGWKRQLIGNENEGVVHPYLRHRLGRRRARGERYIAAIEPWHGHQVAVYRPKGAAWQRRVIDDSLLDGHTTRTADLNGDGDQELIAGFRGGTAACSFTINGGQSRCSMTAASRPRRVRPRT